MGFAEFHADLRRRHGDEAATARHEIHFLRLRTAAPLRALLALLRDAWLCLRLPPHPPHLSPVVAMASLAGSNGWGALKPVVDALAAQGVASTLLIHPRLRGRLPGQLPARPAPAAWRHALGALRRRHGPPGEAWVVSCCVCRLRLWTGVWQATLAGRPEGGEVLLHNDFDMYAAALIEAGQGRWRSTCVQHGLPTDEFFPTRAPRQLLWGASSLQVYRQRVPPGTTLLTGGTRAMPVTTPDAEPRLICLVSQTHTGIFGRPLQADFVALAQALHRHFKGRVTLRILLHPEEARGGHPYDAAGLGPLCQRPPHGLLGGSRGPALVVGFCSTALLDAALSGHPVLGVAWAVPASHGALAVGRPPWVAADHAALLAQLDLLLTDADARADWLARQQAWLEQTFATGMGWVSATGLRP